MKTPIVELYVQRLDRELRKRFVIDARMLEGTREHLADLIQQGQARGHSLDVACEKAIARFGAPEIVAAAAAADRSGLLYRGLLVAAIVVGVAIAHIDASPGWDDAGISAGAMALAAGAFGLIGPRKPWAWALGVGIWIPAAALVHNPSFGALAMLVVLAFPFMGAYLGMAMRRAVMPVPS
ncbi:MAG: hypothetical protein ABI442_09580 [Gemmatimonadaceae bacterium]